MEYGTDLSTVETLSNSHQLEHQKIQNFRREIEKCIADGVSYSYKTSYKLQNNIQLIIFKNMLRHD